MSLGQGSGIGSPIGGSNIQARDAHPGVRVFIWGVEVTADFLNYTYDSTDGRQPSQIQITLNMGQDPTENSEGVSQLDKYIVTDRDMLYILQRKQAKQGVGSNNAGITTLYPTPFSGMLPNNTLLNNNGQPLVSQELYPQITGSYVVPAIKKSIIDKKVDINLLQPVAADTNPLYTTLVPSLTKYMFGPLEYYPFESGKPVFHVNDAVRVAIRDPYNPARWYWRFSGLLSDYEDVRDKNNTQTLVITAEGPTKMMRYARFSTNPGIVDSKIVGLTAPPGGFATGDDLTRTFTQSRLAGKTMPEILAFLFFGENPTGNGGTSKQPPATVQQQQDNVVSPFTLPTAPQSAAAAIPDPYPDYVFSFNSKSDGQKVSKSLHGIGQLRPEKAAIFLYGNQTTSPTQFNTTLPTPNNPEGLLPVPASTIPTSVNGIPVTQITTNQLDRYQGVIDHEILPTDLVTMLQADLALNPSSVASNFPTPVNNVIQTQDIITFIGSNPHIYPVDGGRVIMLMPASIGLFNAELINKDFINDVTISNTPWITKGEQLYNVLERIQFVCYETGKGDIILEMPLYDFDPSNWKLDQVSDLNSIDPFLEKAATQVAQTIVSTSRGPFGNRYTVTREDSQGWSHTFSDEKVRTQCVCSPYIIENYESIGKQIDFSTQKVAVASLTHLVPLFGIRGETADPPGYVTSLYGAYVYALSYLNRLNADAYTASWDTVPLVHAWINRPYWHAGRNHIGTTRSIKENLTWGKSGTMTTRLGVHAMRGWRGDLDANNRPIYVAINGYPSRPLNYAAMFGIAPIVTNQPGPASSQGSPGASAPPPTILKT